MSNKFHKRVFVLNYDETTLPMFNTDKELIEFQQALGRMVMYGLLREAQDDMVEVVTAGITQNPLEICAAYWRPTPACDRHFDGTRKYTGGAESLVNGLLETLTKKTESRPFVMAAVLHGDGKWGFHS